MGPSTRLYRCSDTVGKFPQVSRCPRITRRPSIPARDQSSETNGRERLERPGIDNRS